MTRLVPRFLVNLSFSGMVPKTEDALIGLITCLIVCRSDVAVQSATSP